MSLIRRAIRPVLVAVALLGATQPPLGSQTRDCDVELAHCLMKSIETSGCYAEYFACLFHTCPL